MPKVNTNLSSEFWFLSQLHRLGYQAFITLGNTKSVDISVQLKNRDILTFDVKGKESFRSGMYQYLPSNVGASHYFVFVGLEIQRQNGRIKFLNDVQCYIVESKNLGSFAFNWKSSNSSSKGYGLDQNILRIINFYTSENDIRITKSDKIRIARHKKSLKVKTLSFRRLKSKIITLNDFENRFWQQK